MLYYGLLLPYIPLFLYYFIIIMGCMVEKQQQIDIFPKIVLLKVDFKCKICVNPYNISQYAPMILNCGHTICQSCINAFPKSQCPFDKIKFDKRTIKKNFQVITLYEQLNSLQKTYLNENGQNVDIYCKKMHKIHWKNKLMICTYCHLFVTGWQCQQCKYNRCLKCSSLKPNKLCFNNHPTQWILEKQRCVSCNQSRSGWQCKKCNYNLCSKCQFIPKNKIFCPNGHKLWWLNKTVGQCIQCQTEKNGFSCKSCKYNICDNCLQIQYDSKKCPNDHKTQWNSQKKNFKCQRCKIKTNLGFTCNQCEFFICVWCSHWKNTMDLCPNNHQLVWIKQITQCKYNNRCKGLQMHGFRCRQCDFKICSHCKQVNIKSKICFNSHRTKFTSQQLYCLECNTNKTFGWFCDQCQYSFCTDCTNTRLQGKYCPNNHLKIWKSNKSDCLICRKFNNGWYCDECKIMICSKCEGNNLQPNMCPNNHYLKWIQNETLCISCNNMNQNLWYCQECNFYSCMKCTKVKLKKLQCPNQHALFQFQAENLLKCQVCDGYTDKYYNCINQCLTICIDCYNNIK